MVSIDVTLLVVCFNHQLQVAIDDIPCAILLLSFGMINE